MALPQAIDILNYLHLIFLHVREFHRTLSEVVSSLTADHSFIQSPQERHLEEHSATQPLLSILRIVPHLVYATQTCIRQNHVILNIAQIQHHPTFIGISCSLYISFIQANTQFVSASTMYAMQSNANSCMPSAPFARSGSPPRCCKHLPSYGHYQTSFDWQAHHQSLRNVLFVRMFCTKSHMQSTHTWEWLTDIELSHSII